MYSERLPPHDVEAEEAVVGSLLIDGEAIAQVDSFLKPEDFYQERLRFIFQARLNLFARPLCPAEASGRQEAPHGVAYPRFEDNHPAAHDRS